MLYLDRSNKRKIYKYKDYTILTMKKNMDEFILANMNKLKKEELLDSLVKEYGCLLHGSRTNIAGGILLPSRGNIYATDNAGIAILKAIYSNNGSNMNDNTIGERGFVYILPSRKGFEKSTRNEWEFVSSKNSAFHSVIEVLRSDFKYPVYGINKERFTPFFS